MIHYKNTYKKKLCRNKQEKRNTKKKIIKENILTWPVSEKENSYSHKDKK